MIESFHRLVMSVFQTAFTKTWLKQLFNIEESVKLISKCSIWELSVVFSSPSLTSLPEEGLGWEKNVCLTFPRFKTASWHTVQQAQRMLHNNCNNQVSYLYVLTFLRTTENQAVVHTGFLEAAVRCEAWLAAASVATLETDTYFSSLTSYSVCRRPLKLGRIRHCRWANQSPQTRQLS